MFNVFHFASIVLFALCVKCDSVIGERRERFIDFSGIENSLINQVDGNQNKPKSQPTKIDWRFLYLCVNNACQMGLSIGFFL